MGDTWLRLPRQEKEEAVRESSARLGRATEALEGMTECVVCFEPFNNKDRRIAFLDPCKHLYATPPLCNRACHADSSRVQ